MNEKNCLKAFAVDIDGVLLKDTFSPVIKKIIEKFGGIYTNEIENNVFSRPQKEAAEYCIKYLNLNYSIDEFINLYFNMRADFLKNNPSLDALVEGVKIFLELLSSYNLRIICYGGLSKEYFKKKIGKFVDYFEEYICTNEIRPGIQEIVKEYFRLNYSEVLFFDDVCSVALEAKRLGVPFIGVTDQGDIGFQKSEMVKNNIKCIVKSVKEINNELIEKANVCI